MANFSTANVAQVVTPSDTVSFANGKCAALYVGVSGDITMINAGVAVLFKNVQIGILPVECTRVNATATTAASILALY